MVVNSIVWRAAWGTLARGEARSGFCWQRPPRYSVESGPAPSRGWVPPGGTCFNTGQCIQDGDFISVFCDDNGFAYDGEHNCCRYQGYCQSDEECCGTSFCYQGQCTVEADDSDYGGPDPGQGLPLGAQCSYAAQCEGGGYYVDCDNNGGFVPACCLIGGQVCSTDLDCCGMSSCVYQAAYRYAIRI